MYHFCSCKIGLYPTIQIRESVELIFPDQVLRKGCLSQVPRSSHYSLFGWENLIPSSFMYRYGYIAVGFLNLYFHSSVMLQVFCGVTLFFIWLNMWVLMYAIHMVRMSFLLYSDGVGHFPSSFFSCQPTFSFGIKRVSNFAMLSPMQGIQTLRCPVMPDTYGSMLHLCDQRASGWFEHRQSVSQALLFRSGYKLSEIMPNLLPDCPCRLAMFLWENNRMSTLQIAMPVMFNLQI